MRPFSNFLIDRTSKGTTLLAIAMSKYGAECLSWDPAALRMQLAEDCGVQPDPVAMDRLHAAVAALTSNDYFVTMEAFTIINTALGSGAVITDMFIPAGLEDIIWGVTEMNLLMGDDYWQETYSFDIKRYTGIMLEQYGLYKPPQALSFAEYSEGAQALSQEAFLDDEVSYQAHWERQEERKKALEEIISQGLKVLFMQLKELPLAGKDTTFIDGVLANFQ